MIPKFLVEVFDKWIKNKVYGELKVVFQHGRIQRWTETESHIPPPKSSGPLENPGVVQTNAAPKPEN